MSFIAAGIGAAGAIGAAVVPKLFGGSSSSAGQSGGTSSTTSYSGPSPNSPYMGFANDQLNGHIAGLANAPYTPYDTSKMFAPLNNDQNVAFNQVRNAPQIAGQYASNAASSMAPYQNVNPITAGAGAFSRANAMPDAVTAAQPYMDQAGKRWTDPGVADSYLNPYINSTVNTANQLQTQNFMNNVAPGINNSFVASGGGLGSKQYGNAFNMGLTNLNQNIGSTSQGALANAYNSAAGIFGNDQSRMAGLASTAGSNATNGMGALSNLGTSQGNNAALGVNTGIGQAGAWNTLGNSAFNNTLTGANALLQVGNQEQQNAQLPLTADYQQFKEAQQWPYQTAGWAAQTANQYQWPQQQTSTTNSTGSTGQTGTSAGSPLGIGAGLGAAVGAIPGVGDWFSGLFNNGIPTPASQGVNVGGIGGYNTPAIPLGPNQAYKRGGHFRNFARGGYLGMDAASSPEFNWNPGYWGAPRYHGVGPYTGYADGGVVAPSGGFFAPPGGAPAPTAGAGILSALRARAMSRLPQPQATPAPPAVAAGDGGAGTGGVGGSATDGSGGSAAAGVGGDDGGTYARGGYLGMDNASLPPFFKWRDGYYKRGGGVFATGGFVPVVKSAKAGIKKDIASAKIAARRAAQADAGGGLTRALSTTSPRSGFLRNANV